MPRMHARARGRHPYISGPRARHTRVQSLVELVFGTLHVAPPIYRDFNSVTERVQVRGKADEYPCKCTSLDLT
eukprot:COSAG02_NODE_6585_length_3476_cov_2.822328_3_plen_73_part_00